MDINTLLLAKTGGKSTKNQKNAGNKGKNNHAFEFNQLLDSLKADKAFMGFRDKKTDLKKDIKGSQKKTCAACHKNSHRSMIKMLLHLHPDVMIKDQNPSIVKEDLRMVKETLKELIIDMPERTITSKKAFMVSFTQKLKEKISKPDKDRWQEKAPGPKIGLENEPLARKADVLAQAVSKILDFKKILLFTSVSQKQRPLCAGLLKEVKRQIDGIGQASFSPDNGPVRKNISEFSLMHPRAGAFEPNSYTISESDPVRDKASHLENKPKLSRTDPLKAEGFASLSKQQSDLIHSSKVEDIDKVIIKVLQRQIYAKGELKQEINVRLIPESLGELRIKVSSDNQKLNIVIKTQHYHAGEILKETIQDLQNNLINKGLDSNILITMENNAFQNNKGFSRTYSGTEENESMDYGQEKYEIPEREDLERRITGWETVSSYHLNILV